MAVPGIPTNFYAQQANRQVYLSWDITAGATGYAIQRSLDGVNFTPYATVSINNYTDTAVSAGILYYYIVAATNGSGTGIYTSALQIIPTPTGEMSLGQIRLNAQQRADRVGSNFVTLPEWNSYINQSQYELYDLLITIYEDQYVAAPAQFVTTSGPNGFNYLYPLPNGLISFTNGIDGSPGYIAPPFYKLRGVDLGISSANNAWVTVDKFMFESRNRYVYPNTASTIYGVFNLQYRLLGDNIEFIPPPSSNQPMRIWYYPRLLEMVKDTDISSTSISGWIEYVIVDAAIKALQKEESDVTILMAQKEALRRRIMESASNRDAGQPDSISDVRQNGYWGSMSGGYGSNGPVGGY